MSNTLKYAEDLNNIKAKITELSELLNRCVGFELNEVLESYASMFSRFCPFEVGDRVQLKENIDPPEDSGWYGSRHFLIKGAIATVRDRGYQDGSFCFGVEFDNETWIDQDGEINPVINKHLFYLPEDSIERLQCYLMD